MHKLRRKGKDDVFDVETYIERGVVPLSWQVYGKHKLGNVWIPLSQQRKSKEDAEKDLLMIKKSPISKIPPLIKEVKLVQVPTSKTEMSQRKMLKGLEKHKLTRGLVETLGGTISEIKIGGKFPMRLK